MRIQRQISMKIEADFFWGAGVGFAYRFQGAPYRSTCLLQPTSSSLVNVTEWVSECTDLHLTVLLIQNKL